MFHRHQPSNKHTSVQCTFVIIVVLTVVCVCVCVCSLVKDLIIGKFRPARAESFMLIMFYLGNVCITLWRQPGQWEVSPHVSIYNLIVSYQTLQTLQLLRPDTDSQPLWQHQEMFQILFLHLILLWQPSHGAMTPCPYPLPEMIQPCQCFADQNYKGWVLKNCVFW